MINLSPPAYHSKNFTEGKVIIDKTYVEYYYLTAFQLKHIQFNTSLMTSRFRGMVFN